MLKVDGNSVSYPGSKNVPGIWQWIIALLPSHTYYAEPFVGSGAVLRRKAPALQSFAFDLNAECQRFLQGLCLPGVEVGGQCGLTFLEQMHGSEIFDSEWCVYLDPPYVPETRSKKTIYRYEWNEFTHRRLLAIVTKLPCHVVLSGYESQLYSTALASWYQDTRPAMTRGGMRTESVWCNFDPQNVTPHENRIDACGWRERDRISKKVKRWENNFRVLPRHERRAILDRLILSEQEAN